MPSTLLRSAILPLTLVLGFLSGTVGCGSLPADGNLQYEFGGEIGSVDPLVDDFVLAPPPEGGNEVENPPLDNPVKTPEEIYCGLLFDPRNPDAPEDIPVDCATPKMD